MGLGGPVTLVATMGGILFFLCALELGRAALILSECQNVKLLHEKLLYDNRLTYTRDYFPTDYKVFVKYEEVLRCQNITTLINKGITVKELRYLWGIVNEGVLRTIERVLPLKHPSLPYITDLLTIFKALLKAEQEVDSDHIQEILDRRSTSDDDARVKAVTPKALLDDCYQVLCALYGECVLCEARSDMEDALRPAGTQPALSHTAAAQTS